MKKKINSKKKTKKSEEKRQKAKPLANSSLTSQVKEESKLEEEIKEIKKEVKKIEEDEEDFFEEPVRQIPVSAEAEAPVLERIVQRETSNTIIETNQERAEENKKRIDYSPNSNQPNYGFQRNTAEDEERKYETNFAPPVLSRREISPREIRQEFLKPREENIDNNINEQLLNEIEFVEEERRLPFEEEQKKYKRLKLR
jgi:hypothetical protein